MIIRATLTTNEVGTGFPPGVFTFRSNSFHEFTNSSIFFIHWTWARVIVLFDALSVYVDQANYLRKQNKNESQANDINKKITMEKQMVSVKKNKLNK